MLVVAVNLLRVATCILLICFLLNCFVIHYSFDRAVEQQHEFRGRFVLHRARV